MSRSTCPTSNGSRPKKSQPVSVSCTTQRPARIPGRPRRRTAETGAWTAAPRSTCGASAPTISASRIGSSEPLRPTSARPPEVSECINRLCTWPLLRRPFPAVDSASSLLASTVEREAAPAGRPSASCGSKERGFQSRLPDHVLLMLQPSVPQRARALSGTGRCGERWRRCFRARPWSWDTARCGTCRPVLGARAGWCGDGDAAL